MVGEFLRKMRKIFFFFCCSNWEDWDKYFAKRMVRKALLLFCDKEKNYFWISLTPYGALTLLNKIHRQLSHVKRTTVWYFICAALELLSIWFLHHKNQDENPRKRLAHFRLWRGRRGENLVEPTGSASNKIRWLWATHSQEEWLKELEDTSPTNEAEGQTTTSASRTELLEN